MQFVENVIAEGEIQTTAIPEEGLFLLSYMDMDCSIYQKEGTWKQIQDFIIDEIEAYGDGAFMVSAIINSRRELLELDL